MGLPHRIEVIADPGLVPGSVILESDRGWLDTSVDTQLAEIERGFADLVRRASMNLSAYREKLEGIETCRWTGTVSELVGLLVESKGPAAAVGDFCEIRLRDGRLIRTQVIGFRDGRVLSMPLEETDGLHLGDPITARQEDARMEAGPGLLGRVIDGFGRPLDDLGPIGAGEPYELYARPPGPLDREPIGEALATGIRAIDSLLTCGKGQRIGIFGGSGVGKSTLLGSMARYSSADVSVIALIGERNREVRDFIDHELGPEGLKKSVLVVATSDRPAPLRIRAAFVALAVAEYFRDQGKDVLLVMDSVTRLAMAQREIGLAPANLPARKGTRHPSFTCSPRSSNGPESFATVPSPDSSPCWWRATISMSRSATRSAPFSMATSCCRAN